MTEHTQSKERGALASPMRVLFLDGRGCNPDGFKPTFIRNLGYRVTAPLLPDLDFPLAVEVAEQAFQSERPQIVVGYSRGASVALSLTDRTVPRLLIAPALHWISGMAPLLAPLILLHSATDDGLCLDSVQEHMQRIGLTQSALRIVGEDHTMIDQRALLALDAGLTELANYSNELWPYEEP